jgi:3-deoxy-7-phosphoheptulonate synthase
MSLVLIYQTKLPVVRIGRIAGQYAKPRSKPTEEVNGTSMPTYRGDLFNSFEAEAERRVADPSRLVLGYQTAALTLNFVRALTEGGGFADLHHPEFWELGFMKDSPFVSEYEEIVQSISNSIKFVETVSPEQLVTLKRVHMFTSHEALNLYYDSAQTRQVPHTAGWFNLSSHMVWLGNRTRNLDEGHVEFLRGIQNPIGIKVGGDYNPEEIVKLVEILNPKGESGKIAVITRMGAQKVEDQLPALIDLFRKHGRSVLWMCDPMHGNTYATQKGIKTRDFEDILDELSKTIRIHDELNGFLGGVHFELTGENVTECVGGSRGVTEDELNDNYLSYCDPRLNYRQSLEMAFRLAAELKSTNKLKNSVSNKDILNPLFT